MGKLYAGLDVSDKMTALCIVDEDGDVLLETTTETTPHSIAQALKPFRRRLKLVGQEAGNSGPWLRAELSRLKFKMISLDPSHAHSALQTRLNKTDANDAHGLALLLSRGFYRATHDKSTEAMRVRAVLVLRESIVRKITDLNRVVAMTEKRMVIEKTSRRVRIAKSDSQAALRAAFKSVATSCEVLARERRALDDVVAELAEGNPVCRRLMTIPGVGPIAALTFFAAVDDPTRFKSSRAVGVYFGLTPRVFQSGQSSRSGGISHRGDSAVRKALYAAAFTLVAKCRSTCSLRRWACNLARTKGNKTAYVACARKLAVLMHHLWLTGEEFDPAR